MNALQLKNSILQYAMQGKLVPQDSNDESVTALLEQVLIKKEQLIQEKIIKKEKILSPISSEETPFDIPESWKWVKLEDIAFITGGYAFKSSDYIKDGVRVIRISDFNEKGFVNNKIVRHVYSESYKSFLIEDKDILLCMTGGTVGKSLFVRDVSEPMMTNQRVATIKVNPAIAPDFVNFAILSPAIQEIIMNSKNSTNDNISMSTIKRFPIPLPPIQEQTRIVNKVRELFNKIDIFDSNKKNIDKMQLDFPKKLENSILHYAIQGKLVDQDSNDEPAAELVKLIQEEKTRLIKEKVIKKEKDLSPIINEEIPFDIPESWDWVRVSDICRVNPKNQLEDEEEAAFISMKLIEDGLVNNHSYELRKWKEIKKGYTHFQTGDIVIAKITPCFENLKSAIIKDLPNNIGAGTTELFVLRPYLSNIDKNYLLWIFKSSYFIKGGISSFSGTAGQQRVSRIFLENLVIPLPPLNEQKRIVEKINNLRGKIGKL